MPDRAWYYSSGGQQQGPVSTALLKQLAASGEIQPGDLVWTDNMANWSPANTVKGLFSPSPEAEAYKLAPATATADVETAKASPNVQPAGDVQYSEQLQAAKEFARQASREAAGAVQNLVTDPWGRVGTAFEQLGPKRAMLVGGVFLGAFVLCCILAAIIKSAVLLPAVDVLVFIDAGTFIKSLLVLLAYVGTLVGTVALFRILARTGVDFAADLFVVGAALLPLAVFVLLTSVLDLSSGIIQWFVGMLGIFAGVTSVLMLYNGLNKAVRLSDRLSGLAAPTVVAAATSVAMLLTWLFGKF